MKKKYYYLILPVLSIIFILTPLIFEFSIDNKWKVGVFLCIAFLPLVILLFQLQKDTSFNRKIRVVFKIAFWYFLIGFLLPGFVILMDSLLITLQQIIGVRK